LLRARQENEAMLEENVANEQRHARDVAELEGMLESAMAENEKLKRDLNAAGEFTSPAANASEQDDTFLRENASIALSEEEPPRARSPTIDAACDAALDHYLEWSERVQLHSHFYDSCD